MRSSRTSGVAGVVLVCASAALFSCGGGGGGPAKSQKPVAKAPVERATADKAAPAKAAKPAPAPQPPSADGGQIVGKISFGGDPGTPAKLEINKDVEVCGKTEKLAEALQVDSGGGLANAVVYLKQVKGGAKLAMPKENPVIDQEGCRYEPHVLLAPAGATIDIVNSDGILHNLHTYSTANPPFNAAQPKFKRVIRKTLDQPEFIKLTCDVHGWMLAWIVVHDHPYYALTGSDGSFQLSGVPNGDYEITVWHETLGEKSGQVSVKSGEPARFDLTLN